MVLAYGHGLVARNGQRRQQPGEERSAGREGVGMQAVGQKFPTTHWEI